MEIFFMEKRYFLKKKVKSDGWSRSGQGLH